MFICIFYMLKDGFYFAEKVLKIIFVVMIAILFLYTVDLLPGFIEALVRPDMGVTGRDKFWKEFIDTIDWKILIFGTGLGLGDLMLRKYGFSGFHNSFMDMVENGGFLWILLYIILIAKQIHLYKKLYKSLKVEASLMFGILFSMLFYQLFETILVFGIGYYDASYTMFVYTIPLLYSNYLLKNKNRNVSI